jgi:predicted ABC-type ATPase
MNEPELIFVVGCNAAGKSTFIRTRMVELENFEILMADVYKSRTKGLAKNAIITGKNILIETVFNDASFKDLADEANNAKYNTSLVVLFLDDPEQSTKRVAFRGIQQSGIAISGSNIKINFNESFKNVANYFFYFDKSDFVYTGTDGVNRLIMSFKKGQLLSYCANELTYPQKFAAYSIQRGRLNKEAYEIITANKDFKSDVTTNEQPDKKFNL